MSTSHREATYPSNAPTMTDGSAVMCRDRALKTKTGEMQRRENASVQSNLFLCKPGKYGISQGPVSYEPYHKFRTVNPQLVVSGDKECPEARKEALYGVGPYGGDKATSEEGTQYRMSGCKVAGVENEKTNRTTKREFDEVDRVEKHPTIPIKKICPIHRVWLRRSIADLNLSNLLMRKVIIYLKDKEVGSNIPKSLISLDIYYYLYLYHGEVSQIDPSWVARALSIECVDSRQPYLN